MASIGRKVRSELDLDDVLRVAVETAGVAVGVSRCFLRIGETDHGDADRRRVDGRRLRPGRGTGGAARRLEPRSPRAANGRHRRRPRGTRAEGSGARRRPGAPRSRHARHARDARSRLRPDDRSSRLPPRRAGRLVGRRDRTGRGGRARARDRDPRGSAPEGERAAPRTADGAPEGGPGRHERAASRDRAPAARRRGDEAARCGRGGLLPLRRRPLDSPLRSGLRARPGAGRARVPRGAPGRGAVPRAGAPQGLRGVRERDLGPDDLVGRATRAFSGSPPAIPSGNSARSRRTCSRRSRASRRSRSATLRASSRAFARRGSSAASTGSRRLLPSICPSRTRSTRSRTRPPRRSAAPSRRC